MQHFSPALQVSVIPRSHPTTQPGSPKPAVAYDRTARPLRTGTETPWRRRTLLAIGYRFAESRRLLHSGWRRSLQGKPRSGYVEMSQVQAAYIGSGSAGRGTLRFRGQHLPVQRRWPWRWRDWRIDNRCERRCVRAAPPQRLPGRARAGALWLRPWHYERGRPVVAERAWRRYASEDQAHGG